GLKISYDVFFQKIFSYYEHKERLESLLSALLNTDVKIKNIMPREGIRLAEEGSFTIMDIVAELSDKSIINVEMQNHGYYFPGERSCCYEADLIMRQYNRMKHELKENFTYNSMPPVYLLILMEHSSKEFKEAAPYYIHNKCQYFDSGVKSRFLAHTTYFSLDTFHTVVHNIDNRRDAWLTFLSSDNPADIIKLCNTYPEFKEYYQDIADFRKNPKELIYMFSKSLAETDRNTQRYMVEDMQQQIETLGKEKDALVKDISSLKETNDVLQENNSTLLESNDSLQKTNNSLQETNNSLQETNDALLAYIKANGLEVPPELLVK
ncbi:MAG: PD-(D/E)XK nuclease family transposase, partial [Eubacterium sp.]|nr:PD-(D/E)XK nuclease family transposase [Eubacterium sp.]